MMRTLVGQAGLLKTTMNGEKQYENHGVEIQ